MMATRPATDRFPCVSLVMDGDHTAGVLPPILTASLRLVGVVFVVAADGGPPTTVPDVDFTVGSVAWALVRACVAAIPLGVSLWALLDAARRPRWAWALAGRRQVVWMAVIMAGILSVFGGLVISGWYLLKVRPVVAAVESGRF